MSEFLSVDLQRALATDAAVAGGRTVHAGGQVVPVLRHSNTGFVVERAEGPRLRGLVDVYEGDRHVFQALVVLSREDDREQHFELKYRTPAVDTPPLADFVRDGEVSEEV